VTQLIKSITLLCLFLTASSVVVSAEEGAGKKTVCAVSCVDPDISTDSKAVIDVIKAITKALAAKDYPAMTRYMDPNCTTYDENLHKLVVGRDNIISDVKAKVAADEARLKVPTIGFTIDHPYAIVTGNQAVVTFVLIKEIGGDHPVKFEEHCSDVFIKRDGEWKKLHFCGEGWKEMK
jgi:ABC-type Zn uptake system ZnuABC Zn-binding protein ZnuA